MAVRNLYIVTPGRVHIAVDDPISETLSLETACGRSLVDGLTQTMAGPIRSLAEFDHVLSCRRCFETTGETPTAAGFARPSRFRRRRRPR